MVLVLTFTLDSQFRDLVAQNVINERAFRQVPFLFKVHATVHDYFTFV